MTFKQKIHEHYLQLLSDQVDAFRGRITALTEDSRNDAKGSAGDKHETALSMMHIEQEKLNSKIAEILNQKSIFERIDPNANSSVISLGSLVKVNDMTLYVSTALQKVTVNGINVIAVSAHSPLGAKILGKAEGYSFDMNGNHFEIHEVC